MRRPLSIRELYHLDMAARGYTPDQVARMTGGNARTIRGHRDSAMAKLGAHSIAQAVGTAFRKGYLE